MSVKPLRALVVPFFSLLVLLVACREGAGKELKLGDLTFSDHGTKEVKGKSAFKLEADNFYFAPTFLRGEAGQQLRLEIENESGTVHNFSVPGQVDRDIPAMGRVSIEVTFPQSGVLRFFCKYHAAQGMNGEFLAGASKPQPVSQRDRPQPGAATDSYGGY